MAYTTLVTDSAEKINRIVSEFEKDKHEEEFS